MKAKVCSTCKEEKNIEEYYKCKRNRDGRHYRCKSCCRICDQTESRKSKRKINNATEKVKNRRKAWAQSYYNETLKTRSGEGWENHKTHTANWRKSENGIKKIILSSLRAWYKSKNVNFNDIPQELIDFEVQYKLFKKAREEKGWRGLKGETVKTKVCSKCKKEKAAEEYYVSKYSNNGLHSWCKLCHVFYNQSKKRKARQKAYRQSEKGADTYKTWHQSENAKIWLKNYRRAHREKDNARAKIWRKSENGIKKTITNLLRYWYKNKNVNFDTVPKEVLDLDTQCILFNRARYERGWVIK